MSNGLTPEQVNALFTRAGGDFAFARWGRPIVPVVFGLDDATLPVIKGAIEAVVALADHRMAETDPELGANTLMFFLRDWNELRAVPGLDRMIPDLGPLLDRLIAAGANQYRVFRFQPDGGIKAVFALVRMDTHLSDVPAETLALSQAVQMILLWSDTAFTDRSPLATLPDGRTILRPEIGDLIRAAYDPLLSAATKDAAFGLRLFARLGRWT